MLDALIGRMSKVRPTATVTTVNTDLYDKTENDKGRVVTRDRCKNSSIVSLMENIRE